MKMQNDKNEKIEKYADAFLKLQDTLLKMAGDIVRGDFNLNKAAEQAIKNAKAQGCYGKGLTFECIVALCHYDLSMALEEHCNQNPLVYFNRDGRTESDLNKWAGEKLKGELAHFVDCIIRILEYCGFVKADIQKVFDMSMELEQVKANDCKEGGNV